MTVTTLPATRTAATVAHGGALSLSHMSPHEAWMFCESLAQTPLLPDAYRKQPASVLWALEYGRALGLDVVTTITTIHVIKGKPCQSADLMLGRARSAGHRVRIKSERTRCVVSIQRHDDPDDETVIEWTLDDAVTAGLCQVRNNKPWARDKNGDPTPWEKFPRAMLRARSIAEAVRIACPEVLHGAIYTPEELGEVVDQDGNPVVVQRADAPPVQQAVTVVQSTPNGTPAEAAPPADELSPQARAMLDAAQNARTPEEFAQVRAAAVEAGAPAPFLARLDGIDAEKRAAAEHGQHAPTLGSADETAEQPVNVGAADDGYRTAPAADERAHADAENALRIAASHANLNDLDAAFERTFGKTIEQAPAVTLDAFRKKIEATAGGDQ